MRRGLVRSSKIGRDMAIFLVVPTGENQGIKKALADNKGHSRLDFTELPKGQFFVSFSGTSQELSDVIGISDGSSGTGVVAEVSSYYGRASTAIWDWVKSRWES